MTTTTGECLNGLTIINAGRNGSLTMTSREIAEVTGSTHDNVLKTIRALVERGVVFGNETPYIHPQNRQTYTEFRLDYRNTMVVVSGYSPELRARIIDRWQYLEQQAALAAFNIPKTMGEALRLAADAIEERDQLALTVQEQAPKVIGFNRIADAEGSLCLRDAAKALQVRPIALRNLLLAQRWIYGRPGHSGWLAYQDRIQQGLLTHKVTTLARMDGSDKVVEQVRITPKGITRLAQMLQKEVA